MASFSLSSIKNIFDNFFSFLRGWRGERTMVVVGVEFYVAFNPHMHEIFLQRYCMKWVPGDPLKEMIN